MFTEHLLCDKAHPMSHLSVMRHVPCLLCARHWGLNVGA